MIIIIIIIVIIITITITIIRIAKDHLTRNNHIRF